MPIKDAVFKALNVGPVAELTGRIKELEAEVQELRAQSLRLAELADLVEELLIPMAQRDQARIDAAVEAYTKSL
ncbi:MAG TPA: hypothetical protein PKK40_00870 [Marmoricola sp.]|nr:hypothetical protein [Marmoricola sp.]